MKRLMKLFFCILIAGIFLTQLSAQDTKKETSDWKGVVRFKLMSYVEAISGLAMGNKISDLPIFSVIDVVPRISDTVSIPITLDVGGYGFGLESGLELTPVRSLSPGGLIISFEAGLQCYYRSGQFYSFPGSPFLSYRYVNSSWYLAPVGHLAAGWQFLTEGGFLVTPTVGASYIASIPMDSSIAVYPGNFIFYLTLDIGFAYKSAKASIQ